MAVDAAVDDHRGTPALRMRGGKSEGWRRGGVGAVSVVGVVVVVVVVHG